jgi:CBS domain containing-hemolysin-like protein
LPALDLLRKFREGMPHFALIYKRKNELIGFITLDNLLHVLVGKIQDEFHKTRDDWVYNKDGSFSIKGGRSVYLLERALDLDLPLSEEEEEKIDTVDDFVRNYLKRPKSGDKISFDDFDVFIETMEGKHIGKIKVYPKKKHFL